MLTITIPAKEFWSEKDNCFYTIESKEIQLEHSLLSLSKWESKWHKPFFANTKRSKEHEKTGEQLLDYVRCMTITKNVDPRVYYNLSQENIKQINEYINDPMTATTFRDDPTKPKKVDGSFQTAEIIYYEMFKLNIPLEFERRHLNHLLTLIRVMAEKEEQANNPKKMSKSAWANQQRALHAARRKPHI